VNINFKENLTYTVEITVGNNDTANFHGSGDLNVYATPSMIALMENAAKTCVQTELPKGFTTVGVEISVKHLKATPIGMKVRAEALLEKIEGKKLYFNIKAYDEKSKIGEGTHTRYIVNSQEFMKKVNE
jgi:fluoroacetyl-CoA thioesterase